MLNYVCTECTAAHTCPRCTHYRTRYDAWLESLDPAQRQRYDELHARLQWARRRLAELQRQHAALAQQRQATATYRNQFCLFANLEAQLEAPRRPARATP